MELDGDGGEDNPCRACEAFDELAAGVEAQAEAVGEILCEAEGDVGVVDDL